MKTKVERTLSLDRLVLVKLVKEAKKSGHSVSGLANYILKQWFDWMPEEVKNEKKD